MKDDVAFLRFKRPYLHIAAWKPAFYIHVFTSIFVLVAGLTQFSKEILIHHRPVHKIAGRIYVAAILFVNFPAGMVMAIYANGGIISKTAFVLLDSLWFWYTLQAFLKAKQGNITAHKHFMIRSYALTLSAVTLRTWKIILSHTFDIDPATLYQVDSWLGFVPNLIVAEYLVRSSWQAKKRPVLPIKVKVDNDQV